MRSVCAEFAGTAASSRCAATCAAAASSFDLARRLGGGADNPVVRAFHAHPHLQRVVDATVGAAGLPEDQARYVLAHLFAIALAFLWRLLPASGDDGAADADDDDASDADDDAPPAPRHPPLDVARQALGAALGVFLLVFSFGDQASLFLPAAVLSWCATALVVRLRLNPWCSVLFSMGFLCAYSWLMMCTDYKGWVMNLSGPLMVLTIQNSTLAFQVLDGIHADSPPHPDRRPDRPVPARFARIAAEQRARAVRGGMPSLLEYLAWVYCFVGVLSPPCPSLKEFRRFVRRPPPPARRPLLLGLAEALLTFALALASLVGVSMLLGGTVAPLAYTTTAAFAARPLPFRLGYVVLAVWFLRYKYYGGFMLPEAAAHLAGMRAQEVAHDRQQRKKTTTSWVRFRNSVLCERHPSHPGRWVGVEVATTPAALSYCWNRAGATWLRVAIYERLFVAFGRWPALLGTYATSALWHGLYPTYFLSFFSVAVVQIAFEAVKAPLRKALGGGWPAAVGMWALTASVLHYTFVPFLLMDFWASVAIWRGMYFFGHVVSGGMLLWSWARAGQQDTDTKKTADKTGQEAAEKSKTSSKKKTEQTGTLRKRSTRAKSKRSRRK